MYLSLSANCLKRKSAEVAEEYAEEYAEEEGAEEEVTAEEIETE